MAKKQETLEQKQLFSQVNLLRACANNEYDISRIIGYSVFEALSTYKPTQQNLSLEQKKFEEIKTVYKQLEKNINKCIKKGAENTSQELIVVENKMFKYALEKNNPKSIMLEEIVNTNAFKRSAKNFGEYIENKGDRAYRTILDKGDFKGNRNILLNDYETLTTSFI